MNFKSLICYWHNLEEVSNKHKKEEEKITKVLQLGINMILMWIKHKLIPNKNKL